MPLQSTSGAASYDAFGGGVAAVPKYIEDYFSTYLVTGDGTAPAVNNGIDLSTKGGLVWIKKRSAAGSHSLFDTARGANLRLISNDTAAQDSVNLSFTTTGFSNYTLDSGVTYASWSWAKAPKFFDIVTWTGDGTAPRTINHNLGSTPGCIIVKRVSGGFGEDWHVFHRSLTAGQNLVLNSTAASASGSIGSPTSTTFTISSAGSGNSSGYPYIAYLFAHDSGGFGLSGTDNVISCGSWTGTGSGDFSGPNVDLGYEPQWILFKKSTGGGGDANWNLYDNMRGLSMSASQRLMANSSAAEAEIGPPAMQLTATGFRVTNAAYSASGQTYIYIAIRRGPMKVPTTGTSVFDPETYTGDNSNTRVITTGFPPDMMWTGTRANGSRRVGDRLRGLFTNPGPISTTSSTSDEQFSSYSSPQMNGWQTGNGTVRFENSTGVDYVLHAFRRAPGFFDVVCYTGTGVARTVAHNLTVVPEMMIVKRRDAAGAWGVYTAATGASALLQLESSAAVSNGAPQWNDTAPTSSVFSLAAVSSTVNTSGGTYVWYGFATCPGVSKVGSYTGTGTTQTINCGFTGGARFVMVKRTDSTGNWMVVDTARGLVSAGDPTLYLNSTAAEVTGVDWLDPDSSGFIVNQEGTMNANVSSATYIYLAIS